VIERDEAIVAPPQLDAVPGNIVAQGSDGQPAVDRRRGRSARRRPVGCSARRGRLDEDRILATGLDAYRSTDGAFTFLVNWKQGRGYYWRTSGS